MIKVTPPLIDEILRIHLTNDVQDLLVGTGEGLVVKRLAALPEDPSVASSTNIRQHQY